ncbi:membrane dipeptidase [Streptomyces sp. NPDC015127]|uniref:membrane dipeptidase n=1 Tax=Streptomyces sp. NPDC015127 TaxID=3364939 RepID=UPI0036FF70BC
MADLQDASSLTTVDLDDLDEVDGLDGFEGTAAPPPTPSETECADRTDPLVRARELLRNHPVTDCYSGLGPVLRTMHWYDLEAGESLLETDLPRLRRGGVGAQFWTLFPPSAPTAAGALATTLELVDLVRATVADYPEGMRLALGADELVDAHNRGRIAALLGPAPGTALGNSLAVLRGLYALGVRSITLAGTRWTEGGLTPFGHEMVREMNRLGILVDLSGCSPDTMRRTLTITKAPVIFSHHPSPLPDDVLRALRGGKGVYMVLCTAGTLAATADLVDHVREVAGPESVALSGAYDTGAPHAAGLGDVSFLPHLIAELLDRGWPEPDVTALTWSNVMRVLRDTEFASRAAQSRRGPSQVAIGALDL